MSDDRKRKKSWREVDRGKDKSSRVKKRVVPGTDPYARRKNKSYKAELDKFFDHGVASHRIKHLVKKSGANLDAVQDAPSPERTKLIRKIRQAATFNDFVEATNKLREGEQGLPRDIEILTRVLEHPDMPAVHDALRLLADMARQVTLTQLKALSARLDSLENIADDAETTELIAALREKI